MLKLNNGGKLPDKFKIANQEITVVMEDSLPNNNFGYFCDATNTIKLAKTIDTSYEGKVSMNDEQLRNTFYHELFHVFQFYFDNRIDSWMIINEAGDNIDYYLQNLGFPDSDWLTDNIIDSILDEVEKELVKQGYEI